MRMRWMRRRMRRSAVATTKTRIIVMMMMMIIIIIVIIITIVIIVTHIPQSPSDAPRALEEYRAAPICVRGVVHAVVQFEPRAAARWAVCPNCLGLVFGVPMAPPSVHQHDVFHDVVLRDWD